MNRIYIAVLSTMLGTASVSYAQNVLAVQDSTLVNTVDLDDVQVVATKPLVKMETDKMTYNVEQDADSKSMTVLDMLRKVPMVTVDGQDNITVNGSSDFKVYVDHKPNPMFSSNPSQIFKAMPASMVKSIEVVTNPGAKYDAEGSGGVLDIVLAKQTQGAAEAVNGFNGNATVGAFTRGPRASAFVSGQQGKMSYGVNGLFQYQILNGTDIDSWREQADGTSIVYHQTSDMTQPFGMGNINLGYDIDSVSNISAAVAFNVFHQNLEGHPTTTMSGGRYGDGFTYSNAMTQDIGNTTINANLDYQRFFNPSRSSYMILSYLFTANPSFTTDERVYDANDITLLTLSDLRSESDRRATEHTLQADFTTPVAPTHILNYGAKYINRLNTSDSKFFNLAPDGTKTLNSANSTDYENRQGILAGYAEWKGYFGSMSATAGARYEHTWESMDNGDASANFDKNYGVVVPSGSISYRMGQTKNIGLTYNMRIVRPGITYLNPYVDRTSPTALAYGNVDLDVEKTHNLKLVFNSFSQRIMISANLGCTMSDNQISEYSFLDSDGRLNTTYGNIVKSQTGFVSVFANWLIAPKTRLMVNEALSYSHFKSDALGMSNDGWTSNTFVNLQQTLPWQLQWTIGGFIRTKSYTLQGDNSGMSLAYTNLSRSFCDDRLDLSLQFVTPFTKKLEITSGTHGADYTQQSNVYVPIRQLGITLTWKFGNTKKQFQQRNSNITNDFQEQKQGMQVGNLGNS